MQCGIIHVLHLLLGKVLHQLTVGITVQGNGITECCLWRNAVISEVINRFAVVDVKGSLVRTAVREVQIYRLEQFFSARRNGESVHLLCILVDARSQIQMIVGIQAVHVGI